MSNTLYFGQGRVGCFRGMQNEVKKGAALLRIPVCLWLYIWHILCAVKLLENLLRRHKFRASFNTIDTGAQNL